MLTKRIIGIVVMIWSLLIIGWASVLVYDLSSPEGLMFAKRALQPGTNDNAVTRNSSHNNPFSGG